MRLEASIEGSFQEAMTAEARRAARAVTFGIREATDGLKADLRRQITGAGLGERLARTWRSEVYPRSRQSIGAAGYVWSKAPGLIRIYDQGAVIRSQRGLYLAVPTPAAGKYGDARKKITPGDWERIHGLRLQFVYRPNGPSLLVANNARLTARARAIANIGRRRGDPFTRMSGRTTVPVFILVPQVTVRKRLDVAGAARKWLAELPGLVVRQWHG